MNDYTRNQSARHALEILKMSTLEALYKLSIVRSPVHQLKILKNLDIPEIVSSGPKRRALICGILTHLEKEDEYTKDLGKGYWKITEEGIAAIEGHNRT